MEEFKEIYKSDIKKLKDIIKIINKKLNENKNIVKKFDLRKKFTGVLGEAIALVEIFNNCGESIKYKWKGGKNQDFDLALFYNDKIKKIQIKSSSAEDYNFQIMTKDFDRKLVKDLKKKNLKKVFKIIHKNIDSKDVDYWIFVHVRDKNIFYLLNKKQLIKLLKRVYKNYVNKERHHKYTNYGIDNSGNIRFMLKKVDKKTSKLLNKYKENWKLLTKELFN